MDIDRDLNLIIPVKRGDSTAYVHAMPIGRHVFEEFHAVLAKAFSTITEDGLNVLAALATSKLAIKDAALSKSKERWEAVESGLLREMVRLSNVLYISKNGWDTMPLEVAVKNKIIDADDFQEVENNLCFFTLISHLFRKAQRPMMLRGLESVGGLRVTSSNVTELRDSLTTSTEAETSANNT